MNKYQRELTNDTAKMLYEVWEIPHGIALDMQEAIEKAEELEKVKHECEVHKESIKYLEKTNESLEEELKVLKNYTPTEKVIEEIRDYWDSIDYDLAWQSVVTFYDKAHKFKVIKQKDVLLARDIFENSVKQLIGMLEGKYAKKLYYYPEVLTLRKENEELKKELNGLKFISCQEEEQTTK